MRGCLQIHEMAQAQGLEINFLGPLDHLDPTVRQYQVGCAGSLRAVPLADACTLPVPRAVQCTVRGFFLAWLTANLWPGQIIPRWGPASARRPSPSIWPSTCLLHVQVFLNCSTSDVVATTSLEALAMGKWVICAEHACNAFIARLPNCLIYRCPAEFSRHLQTALAQEPQPLSAADLRQGSLEVQCGWQVSCCRLARLSCTAAVLCVCLPFVLGDLTCSATEASLLQKAELGGSSGAPHGCS